MQVNSDIILQDLPPIILTMSTKKLRIKLVYYFIGIMSRIITPPSLELLTSPDWKDYELLDSGNGLKLERFGPYRLLRPEAEAIWKPGLSEKEWQPIHAAFQPGAEELGGHWTSPKPLPERWQMEYKGLRFWIQTTASRHVGLFPEQASQWDWISQKIEAAGHPVQVLNLFGYSGLVTLAAARSGARVTHVDASKKAISWAQENQKLSGLEDYPIRWIVDDALKFVQREARRGNQYHGIILDPPKFGRGPKGEVWEFYKLLPELLRSCRQILVARPLFLIMTAYAVKASAVTLYYAVQEMMAGLHGETLAGEIALEEKSNGRLLPTAIFARWSSTP